MEQKLTQLRDIYDVKNSIFFNLCDGNDDGDGGDGYPGLSLVKLFEKLELTYTGAN